MAKEGQVFEALAGRKEEHLVSIIYADKDYKKLYLEYCLGGDLQDTLKQTLNSGEKIEEEHIWRILLG